MMKKFFNDNPNLHHCIIADAWKDSSGRHWLGTDCLFHGFLLPHLDPVGVSTQFGTNDMRIFAPALGLRQIHERHTSANIADMIKQIITEEWEIIPSLVVSDNASNALGSSEQVIDFVDELMGSYRRSISRFSLTNSKY